MKHNNLVLIVIAVIGALLLVGFFIQAQQVKEKVKNADYGQEFTLSPGQSASVKGNILKFLSISEDSRCPADVICVWQGQAVAAVQFSGSSGSKDLNLTLLSGSPTKANQKIDGISITLLNVEPYPGTVGNIKPSDYKATFVISEG